jgi:hypothetical protein
MIGRPEIVSKGDRGGHGGPESGRDQRLRVPVAGSPMKTATVSISIVNV